LRWYPSCLIARSTLAAVSGCTPGSWLTTRETVIRLTPATRATSRMVGRLVTMARPHLRFYVNVISQSRIKVHIKSL